MHLFHRRDEPVVTLLRESTIEFAVGLFDGKHQRSDGDVRMLQDERGDERGPALFYCGRLVCRAAVNFKRIAVAKNEFECLGAIISHVLWGDIFDPLFE